VATQLPKSYLHVPPSFQITVDSERIQFQYWERRLAELHYFPLLVDSKNLYKESDDWAEPRNCHMVFLYMGFDPIRAAVSSGGRNKASLFVYSRKSGRLVQEMEDARGYLKLCNGGSKYAQGLTVIIDDFGGNLPLTPTKQDISFGHSGKSHEQNLSAWAGAFAHCYWEHFADIFGNSKGVLSREVIRHIPTVQDILSNKFCAVPATLSQTKMFSTFEYMQFHIQKNTHYIRCKKGEYVYDWVQREGTQIKFNIKGATTAKKTKAAIRKPRKKRAKPGDDTMSADISEDVPPARATRSVVDYTPTGVGSLWENQEDDTVISMEEFHEDPELKGTPKEPYQKDSDTCGEMKPRAVKPQKNIGVGTKASAKKEPEQSENGSSQNEEVEKLVKELRENLAQKDIQVKAAVKTVGALRTEVTALRKQKQQSATPPAVAAAAPKEEQGLTTSCIDQEEHQTELKMLRERCEAQASEMNRYQEENEALQRSVNVHKEVIKNLRRTIVGLGELDDL
jgi:hypothetical protein